MTNGEKFKTAKERISAFRAHCENGGSTCQACDKRNLACFVEWLELEAESEELLPCPFCGGECKTIELFLEKDHFVVCDKCRYTSAKAATEAEAIAAHNRVAKKCRESEVK